MKLINGHVSTGRAQRTGLQSNAPENEAREVSWSALPSFWSSCGPSTGCSCRSG